MSWTNFMHERQVPNYWDIQRLQEKWCMSLGQLPHWIEKHKHREVKCIIRTHIVLIPTSKWNWACAWVAIYEFWRTSFNTRCAPQFIWGLTICIKSSSVGASVEIVLTYNIFTVQTVKICFTFDFIYKICWIELKIDIHKKEIYELYKSNASEKDICRYIFLFFSLDQSAKLKPSTLSSPTILLNT